MKQTLLSLILLGLPFIGSKAGDVTVTMNNVSPTMTLTEKATGTPVNVGDATNRVYSFSAEPGTYVLTAYATDNTTVNGTIEVTLDGTDEQEIKVLTCTIYATNKDSETNTNWVMDDDYTVSVDVRTREGETVIQTIGQSITAGRRTFLALNGNNYIAYLIPSATHQAENYMFLTKMGTLTGNVTVSGAIPFGYDYSISLPADAELFLGMKSVHFTKFHEVEPKNVETTGATKTVTYHLADGQIYNYRTWRENGLTQAGYFTMKGDETKRPQIAFTDEDYVAFAADSITHDVAWNKGYETGDILININERGHLHLQEGESYDLHSMRSWELTDNSTNNYFMEPDFHYTVITPDGMPSEGVVEIDNNDPADPWATLKAVGQGTAIVLVTYDAIGVNYYSNGKTEKTAYMGGEYWGAIWPENTAAFVVTVGNETSNAVPNMTINEEYNEEAKKLAGKYVDAEHDVFYYLDTEEGYAYSFVPEGVAKVEIAYPTIGTHMATYSGFGSEGVSSNEDGVYTVLLKEGRQIVKLTDGNGLATYQVMTAKKCHLEINNETRSGSEIILPGDKVTAQFSGLRHPANKLAGIYNMSAYVTFNGTPNGTALILGSNQYTFGSVAKAQAVSLTIPEDYEESQLVLNDGVIQVTGFGDPIGNHRYTSRIGGRTPNFTAIAHKTYFGRIPDITLNVSRKVTIRPVINVEDAEISISAPAFDNEDGTFTAMTGTYTITASAADYETYTQTLTITDNDDDEIEVHIEMRPKGALTTEIIKNNTSVSETTAPTFDLTGRRVKSTSKPGLYIQNRKKFFIK